MAEPDLTLTACLRPAALDARRGIVRLHPEVLTALGLHPGDPVTMIGRRRTAGIAARAEPTASRALLYADDLILACFQRTLDIMRRAQREATTLTDNGADNLITATSALVEHQLAGNAPLLRSSALTSVPEDIHIALLKEFDRVSGRFSLVFSEGIADGSLRPVDATIAAQMITAMVNAAAEIHRWAPGINQENVAAVYARPLFHGLLKQ